MVKGAEVVSSKAPIWVAVHEDGVDLLDPTSYHPLAMVGYKTIRTFGGPGGHFRLLYRPKGEERQEYVVKFNDPNMHREMTYMVASYINEIVRRDGMTCDVASIEERIEDHETSLMR